MNTQTSRQDFQRTCTELIASKNFTELARFLEKSKMEPPESVVRIGYKNYLLEAGGNKVKLFLLMRLREVTQQKPDDIIQKEACQIALTMDSPQVLEALVKRLEVDKAVFRDLEAVIQKTYQHYIRYGKFMDISKLIEITDSKPLEDLIQEGYRMYLEEVKFISFTGLKKQTKIKPDEEMIMEMYQLYYRNLHDSPPDQADTWVRRLNKLKKITKVDPPEDIAFEMEMEF